MARMMPRPISIPALTGSDRSRNRSIKFGVNEAKNDVAAKKAAKNIIVLVISMGNPDSRQYPPRIGGG